MRPLILHARGRQGGPIACGLAGVAAACALLPLLAAESGMLVAVLGPLTAVSLLGFALGGADPALERITPQPWPRRRAAELAACAVAAALAVLPAAVHEPATLRNLAGLGGLAALGAVALGPRLAWLVPTAFAFTGAAIGPDAALAPLTWPVLEAGHGLGYAVAPALAGAALLTAQGAAATDPSYE